MTWSITIIDLADVALVWHLVAPLLEPAVARSGGRYDLPSLLAGLHARRSLLWVVHAEDNVLRAAFTTRVAGYPLKAMLSVDFLGGDGIVDWLPQMVDTIVRFAAESGLDGCEMLGRHGWSKPLAALGWSDVGVFMEKDV